MPILSLRLLVKIHGRSKDVTSSNVCPESVARSSLSLILHYMEDLPQLTTTSFILVGLVVLCKVVSEQIVDTLGN